MARTDMKLEYPDSDKIWKEVEEYIDGNNLDHYFVIADAKREYWQNDRATLVLRQSRVGAGFNVALSLGNLPWRFQADEFNKMVEDGVTYYRIWWD